MNFKLLLTIVYLFSTVVPSSAQATDYTPQYARFNINNISTIVYNDGRMDHNIETGEAEFEYPKGSGKTAVYQSGFFWLGVLDGQFCSSGSMYDSGLKPGVILSDGSPENPNSPDVRVYRVRRDYELGSMQSEINDGEGSDNEIREQYRNDWYEWPAFKGAPFEDINYDGLYDPEIDVPGIPGAAQSIWIATNDLDTVQTNYFLRQSFWVNLPIGIELQTTVWAYDSDDFLGNVIFKKYKIINKNINHKKIKDLHIALFADPTIGKKENDLLGCDTLLDLGYVYNGSSYDGEYNIESPAIGYTLLKGPIIGGNIDAQLEHEMTAFSFFWYLSYGWWTCYNELYWQMIGRLPTGQAVKIPEYLGGGITKYPFSGNPITRTGWLDDFARSKDNRRMLLNSGPFNMAYGDTQEVIFAVIAAGAEPGVDNIGAVSLLKHYARQVHQFYDNNFEKAETEVHPQVTASAFDREVILSWGSEIENVTTVEKNNIHDFSFQGYNVYQLPSERSSTENGIKIATFDKIDETSIIIEDKLDRVTGRVIPTVVQEGRNTGIDRYLKITNDYMLDTPLNNGTKYYFGVTAYYHNPNESTSPVTLETEPSVVSIIPHDENPGISYTCKSGASIYAIHLQGSSDADIGITIIDPSQLTGHEYEITFHESSKHLIWNLNDITSGEIKLTHQTNITGTDEYYIVDGFRVIITQDTSRQLTSSDVFTFNTPVVTKDEELAKLDVEKINVFPNPYYGGHGNELNQYHNYVMFNHLPERVTFRIFNLAGHLVRTLNKDDDTQFYLWDLQNENRLQAPSGLYIIYIEMPDLQKVKVLKLAIIQREVVPSNF